MGSLMESKLTAEQHALIKKVLVAQTESLGGVEAPIVEDLLKKHRCRTVLDIVGKSLGLLFRDAGFRDIQVRVVLCSPSSVGVKKFRAVVQASADLAFAFFPDLFDRKLLEDLKEWLGDRIVLEKKDPYLCSAIANGTRP